MNLTRRRFLGAIVAAPAIVTYANLMKPRQLAGWVPAGTMLDENGVLATDPPGILLGSASFNAVSLMTGDMIRFHYGQTFIATQPCVVDTVLMKAYGVRRDGTHFPLTVTLEPSGHIVWEPPKYGGVRGLIT